MNLADQIVNSIYQALNKPDKFVPLHEPTLNGNESLYIKECIDTNWVSSVGKFVDRFEVDLANYTGAKYAVVTVNGTSALQLALSAAGVQLGDEVLLPALSFVATANAVAYLHAIPHFIDVEESTLGVDPDKLKEYLNDIIIENDNVCFNRYTNRPIKALVPMHTFGHPVRLEELKEVATQFKLKLVEDAAEGLGSFYQKRHVGTFGLMGILSFNGNKILTTGGGGAILTNDLNLAKKLKYLSTTAKKPHRWEFFHDELGYNFRLPNINAAMGCAQLEQIEIFLNNKRNLTQKYLQEFKNIDGFKLMLEPSNCTSNYWLQTIILNQDNSKFRDEILEKSNDKGLMTRPIWRLLNQLPMYENSPSMSLEVSESLEKRIINIPSSSSLVFD